MHWLKICGACTHTHTRIDFQPADTSMQITDDKLGVVRCIFQWKFLKFQTHAGAGWLTEKTYRKFREIGRSPSIFSFFQKISKLFQTFKNGDTSPIKKHSLSHLYRATLLHDVHPSLPARGRAHATHPRIPTR